MTKRRHLLALLIFAGALIVPAAAQQSAPIFLRGTLVTPDETIADGVVAIEGEKIVQVGPYAGKPAGGPAVATDSFIYPGLINLHDHITWNLFPRWTQNVEFSTRYEWQQRTAYGVALSTPHAQLFSAGLGCDANRFGEVKAIVGGATSVVGSLGPSRPGLNDNECIAGLARNLDFYSGFYGSGPNHEKLRYEVFPLQLPLAQMQQIQSDLASGQLASYVVHLSEGKPTDANAAREFNMFQGQGFLRPGVLIIHGVALGGAQFKQMAAGGVGLIWSPRSNIELYGSTADVATAKQEGVKIAIAPDWSPSGSDGFLQELKYVATWNAGQRPAVFSDAELVKMATSYPAQMAKVDDKIGSLKAGLYADLLLIRKHEGDKNAYQALLHASPSDVRLVVINGLPVYGDADLMRLILPGRSLQDLTLCGSRKSLYIQPVAGVPTSWNEVTERVAANLQSWGTSLAALTQCQGTNLR